LAAPSAAAGEDGKIEPLVFEVEEEAGDVLIAESVVLLITESLFTGYDSLQRPESRRWRLPAAFRTSPFPQGIGFHHPAEHPAKGDSAGKASDSGHSGSRAVHYFLPSQSTHAALK
jgi:hypothetical protein